MLRTRINRLCQIVSSLLSLNKPSMQFKCSSLFDLKSLLRFFIIHKIYLDKEGRNVHNLICILLHRSRWVKLGYSQNWHGRSRYYSSSCGTSEMKMDLSNWFRSWANAGTMLPYQTEHRSQVVPDWTITERRIGVPVSHVTWQNFSHTSFLLFMRPFESIWDMNLRLGFNETNSNMDTFTRFLV